MTDKIVVLVTCGNRGEAEAIAHGLVEARLAACVNIVPGITSYYWWENKLTEDQEILLLIKTSRSRYGELEKEILRLHSYGVPEVIAVPVVEGAHNYLNWIEESLRPAQ
ncbi:MAG: divalent-cation tolerance protein CutA [Acidobacteriota bacterium]